MTKDFPFLIGADPEFNIMLQDKRIIASKLMERLFQYQKGAIRKQLGYKIEGAGEIGWDAVYITGELRPNPSHSPQTVVDNLRRLLQAFIKQSELFVLSTASDRAPIGGHIHLGLPTFLFQSEDIHIKLSSFYIALMLGEDAINLTKRMNNKFGSITDFRVKRKGIYEFRVPSAEWLTTPRIARATLAYIATVYNEIINQPDNFEKCESILIKNEKQGQALQVLAIVRFTGIIQGILKDIKEYIKTFEYYKYYKEDIDFILNPNEVLKQKEMVGFNIIKGWNLIN